MDRITPEPGVDVLLQRGNILLVEFINADQFPGRINPLLPLAAGVFSSIGCSTRWLRFAVSTTNMMAHGRDEITLEPEDVDLLLTVAGEHSPDLIFFTDALHQPHLERLSKRVPKATVEIIDPRRPLPLLVRVFAEGMLDGAPELESHSLEPEDVHEVACISEAPTSYAFEPGNRAAAVKKHDNVYLLTVESCGHALNAWDNAHYKELTGSADRKHQGCAFCTSGLRCGTRIPVQDSAIEQSRVSTLRSQPAWIRAQLRTLAAERGSPDRFPNAVLLERVVDPPVLREVLDCMEEFGLAGHVQLLIACRTDRVGKLEDLLESHRRRFPRSKARLGVYACGVESFAKADLDRFNKLTTPLDGLRAVNTLRRLAAGMPGRFWYDGISFILFTPWTTLESLYLTLGTARLLEISRKEAGNIFQSRMRLHDQLPVTHLARHEGLTEEEETDGAVVMNRRKLFAREEAWKFADPRLRPICRLVLRFDLLDKLPRDALSEALFQKLQEANPSWTPGSDIDLLDLALRFIEAAGSEASPLEEAELLDRAFLLNEKERSRRAAWAESLRFGVERLTLESSLDRFGPLLRSGKKKLISLQVRTGSQFPSLSKHGDLFFRAEGDQLFVASDIETLERASKLAQNQDSWAIEELGLLHGVPPCCARAFANSPNARSRAHLWSAFAAGQSEVGRAAPDLHALWVPSISFVPCSPTCSAANDAWRSWLELMKVDPPPADPAEMQIAELPFEGDGDLVRIPVESLRGDARISYAAGSLPPGTGELRSRLAQGDELEILPGQIRVFRAGALVDFLPPWYLPYSTARTFHPAEYEELGSGVAQLDGTRPRRDKRLLLLEFVTNERWVFDSRHFPFVKGGAEDLGWSTLWFCVGAKLVVKASGSADSPSYEQYMDLSPGEIESLEERLREFRPTHVLTSHPFSPRLLDAIIGSHDQPEILCTSDLSVPDSVTSLLGGLLKEAASKRSGHELTKKEAELLERLGGSRHSWRAGRTDWILTWLGVCEDEGSSYGKYIAGALRPSYRALMFNAEATAFKPHLLVLGGVVCDHFKKVSSDPRYADLDLSGCDHVTGCAYCTWYRGPSSDMHEDPLLLAEQQLRAIAEEACSHSRFQGVLDIMDIRLFTRIDRFARMVLRAGLPPTTFCFEPRVDRLIAVAPRLEEALSMLAPAGHSISLFRMGAENLVEEENERFNKEVGFDALKEGSRILQDLSSRFPESFFFDPTWGYITCSPWTTLEMLESTVERAIFAGFEPLGVWLYTPLLLFRTAPITKLAESQGLLDQTFEDLSLLWEPSINGCPADTIKPWKFEDPRTGAAFALIVRFCAAALRGKYPDSLFDHDELYALLLEEEGRRGPYTRPDLFAREAISATKSGASLGDRSALMLQALDAYSRVPAEEKITGDNSFQHSNESDLDGISEQSSTSEEEGFATDQQLAEDADGPMQEWRKEMERLLRGLLRHLAGSLGRLEIMEVREDGGGELLRLTIELDGREIRLRLEAPVPGTRSFVETPHFALSYERETPLESQSEMKGVRRLAQLIEAAAVRHVPRAVPPSMRPD